MKVISNAAVLKLTAPTPLLKSDPLLTLISTLASPKQLNLSTPKKGNALSLESDAESSSSNKDSTGSRTLTQRNAILKSICGMGMHNALDQAPFYLLGGYSASGGGTGSGSTTNGCCSPDAALVMASISSWMSVADSVRSSGGDGLGDMCVQLNEILASQAYLCSSEVAMPTLADLDVFFALMNYSEVVTQQLQSCIHLKRWMIQCQSSVKDMVTVASGHKSKNGPSVEYQELGDEVVHSVAQPVPVFFYGEEGEDDFLPPDNATPSLNSNAKSAPTKSKAPTADAKPAAGGGGGGGLTEEQKKAAAEKRAKKNAQKKEANAKKNKGNTPPATADFTVSALDIRVGKILDVWPQEGSDKLFCEKVDVGEDEPRQILSGLRNFYTKEEMQDRTVLVLCNLKKRNVGGSPSHGMVLCASNKDHTSVEFVVPPEGSKPGERVVFEGEGNTGDPEPENKIAKKKIFEKLAPDLKTDENGVVVWKGAKSSTAAGPCVASKGMKDGQVS